MTDYTVQIDWLHSLMQELENTGIDLPMGDFGVVYDILEGLRDDVPYAPEPLTLHTVTDPARVEFTGQQPLSIDVVPAHMVVNITAEGVIMDFFDDNTEPDATLAMTFDEWREYADWKVQG
jgi:hypothetical protein